MKQDNTRFKPQKWYANEREAEVLDSHCDAHGVTKSEFVRALVMRALRPQAHRTRRNSRREGSKLGPVLAISFPGWRARTPMPLRL
jgi:hypothetical protein